MLTGPFLSKDWMCANPDYNSSDWVLLGMPFDATCSNKNGTRFAPAAIRSASWGLEEYSLNAERELSEVSFFDAGDLEFPIWGVPKTLDIIETNVTSALDDGKKVFGVGGEHLVTLGTLKSYFKKYNDLVLIHFDAHADLREEYLGEALSHSTVIRRILEFLPASNLVQIGVRSGEKAEFEWMKANKTLISSQEDFKTRLGEFKGCPVFITLDIDVLDSSLVPGTGTQEAGGMFYNELISWLNLIKGQNVVGMDLLEVSPDYDPSGASVAVGAKLIREMLLLFA
ncbi:MAG: agmatinase [Candidatus Gastranaerophilales bacterium]|nr:agmatinase [Candidatus Gastranaerophilales bacterium]